ncbi:MAG: hypothetical protein KY429_12085 [Actinobacteria bacterium]|nr:hypothetical protein [Actinomycetota bacterium]
MGDMHRRQLRLKLLNERLWFWARTHRGQLALMIVGLILLSGFVAYSQLSTSTPVTSEEALSQFRDSNLSFSPPPVAEGVAEAVAPEQQQSGQPAGSQPGSQPQGGAQPAENPCDWACFDEPSPPENGVYEYYQCGRSSGQCTGAAPEPQGTESASGLSRPFPRAGQRIIRTTSERSWTNQHIYSQEHTEEFDLSADEVGVYNHRYKVNVNFGPIQGGSEMRMSPPIRFSSWPMSVGLSWKSSWTDTNREADGDYDCKASAKEEMLIGGTPVRTWLVECHLVLKGPHNRGDVFLKLWLAPEYRNTVQEFYDQNLQTPQGSYSGKWMVTLANLTPKK